MPYLGYVQYIYFHNNKLFKIIYLSLPPST